MVQPTNAQLNQHLQGVERSVYHALYWRTQIQKSTACLMSIKQREDETLRSYISRFNKETLSIDEADDKILVAAFTNGLRKGKFLFSLYKNDPKTMSEVLYRATKYMNAEDALSAREEKPKIGKGKMTPNKNKGARGPEREIGGMSVALNPREEDLRASLR